MLIVLNVGWNKSSHLFDMEMVLSLIFPPQGNVPWEQKGACQVACFPLCWQGRAGKVTQVKSSSESKAPSDASSCCALFS